VTVSQNPSVLVTTQGAVQTTGDDSGYPGCLVGTSTSSYPAGLLDVEYFHCVVLGGKKPAAAVCGGTRIVGHSLRKTMKVDRLTGAQ